jgi:hypothetical protein
VNWIRLGQGKEQWRVLANTAVNLQVLVKACGRAVAQAVSRWVPTTAARVRVWQHVGFVVDKAALGHVFYEYFGFPCQSFHKFLHQHNHLGLAQ